MNTNSSSSGGSSSENVFKIVIWPYLNARICFLEKLLKQKLELKKLASERSCRELMVDVGTCFGLSNKHRAKTSLGGDIQSTLGGGALAKRYRET